MTETAGRTPPVMPPGRELDAEVATLVLQRDVRWLTNWRSGMEPHYLGTNLPGYVPLPHYSTSWDAMRLVVERLVALGWAVDLHMGDQSGTRSNHVSLRRWKPPWGVEASGDTVPHAVALAARKATTSAQQGAEARRE